MDFTAYRQNQKKKQTKDGKYLYYCRLSSFDIHPKKIYFLDGKPYIRMELSKDVNENGDIETSDLLNTSPFDDQDILELFGEKLQILQYIVNTVHTVVQVAA